MRFFSFLFIVIPFLSFNQIGTGQWRMHVPNRSANDVVIRGDQVFSAYGSGLLEVDIPTGEKSLWTAVNSLSDINVTCLGQDNSKKYVFVGYDNGNIDKIDGTRVVNIPSIRLAQIQGNKRINKIIPFGDFIYLATGFSIIKLDPIKDEVKETFYPTSDGSGIIDVAFKGDSIFAMTDNRVLRAKLSNFALADPNQWQEETRIPNLISNAYGGIEIIDNHFFVHFKNIDYGKDTVYRITETGLRTYVSNTTLDNEINNIGQENNTLTIYADGLITNHNSNGDLQYSYSTYLLGKWIYPVHGASSNGVLWVADKNQGLLRMDSEYWFTPFGVDGPPKNEFYSMDWQDGKLAVAGGGISSIANTFSGSGVYLFEDESWKLYDRDNMDLWNGQNIWDFLSVSIDPSNSSRMAIGTYSEIPVSILENGTQVTDTFTPLNSSLEATPLNSNWSLVSSLQYDEDGNLWVLNGFADKPLNVYTKEGLWYNFDCGASLSNKFSRKMVIDYQGNKWFSMEGSGLYGYNNGSNIADPSDDQRIFLNTGENSGNLPSKSVTALAVDFDNELWIGTDNGFAVLYNSEGAFGASPGEYDADRIKVQFEGNVEYVLGNTNITDIEVDGGNRKWFATANSGIILLSADGLEIIEQHTMDNSPLISNNILDLELNQQTGELFIVTDKGLISYRTNATFQDEDYSNVTVFPNPLRPEYQGPVTIQGIQYNSDVKITDIAGNLVYKTVSNGGTASWNGKNLNGEDVKTGVYLIWTASIDGEGKKVGKVLVVR